ncbi:N-(5'-phosphoribosyl)anthranilate isomerase, partial [Methylobacterium trifolii]
MHASAQSLTIKICGLSTPGTLAAALDAGADWIGLVHFPRSPRHVGWDTARALSAQARGRAQRVVLLVDPDDAELDAALEAVDPDLVQLHGSESPERVSMIRARAGRPVMKALGIGTAADLARIPAYARAAD